MEPERTNKRKYEWGDRREVRMVCAETATGGGHHLLVSHKTVSSERREDERQ